MEMTDIRALNEYDQHQLYDEMLDDCYGEVEICGYKYAASTALKNVDPIAYRVGFSDWIANIEEE
jgi:hypothetical protein